MILQQLTQTFQNNSQIINLFARAGGGGSDDNGGGELFVAIGYGVGYGVSKPLKKILPYSIARLVSFILVLLITIIFLASVLFVDSFLVGYIIVLVVIGLWVGWYQVMFDIWHKMSKKLNKTNADIAQASQTDAIWNEQQLHQSAMNIFYKFQDDWTRQDASQLNSYMTTYYANKTLFFYNILRYMNRQNAVINPVIIKIDTYEISDNIDNNLDSFTAIIEAKAEDYLINLTNNQTIFSSNISFIEYWRFRRNGNAWLLDDISQNTANINSLNSEIVQFANVNGMYYSLDMGWLFLPERGQVFSKGGFGISDINNHAMGTINGILTQLYTYKSGAKNDYTYTIGQINIPKYYGQILIKPKPKFFGVSSTDDVKPPDNSNKYNFEWQDFNHKFEVWATDQDRLASFELINPKFMQSIYDIDEKIVLEVVDNIVYFRSSLATNAQTYDKLMEILKQAYKELKL